MSRNNLAGNALVTPVEGGRRSLKRWHRQKRASATNAASSSSNYLTYCLTPRVLLVSDSFGRNKTLLNLPTYNIPDQLNRSTKKKFLEFRHIGFSRKSSFTFVVWFFSMIGLYCAFRFIQRETKGKINNIKELYNNCKATFTVERSQWKSYQWISEVGQQLVRIKRFS